MHDSVKGPFDRYLAIRSCDLVSLEDRATTQAFIRQAFPLLDDDSAKALLDDILMGLVLVARRPDPYLCDSAEAQSLHTLDRATPSNPGGN